MMLADVMIAAMIKSGIGDASFVGPAKRSLCSLLTLASLTLGNGGIDSPTIAS